MIPPFKSAPLDSIIEKSGRKKSKERGSTEKIKLTKKKGAKGSISNSTEDLHKKKENHNPNVVVKHLDLVSINTQKGTAENVRASRNNRDLQSTNSQEPKSIKIPTVRDSESLQNSQRGGREHQSIF